MANWCKNIAKFSLIVAWSWLAACETYNHRQTVNRPLKKLKRSTSSELAQLDRVVVSKYAGERDYWFSCDYQNDCTEIYYKCVGNAVGKKYYDEANEFYLELADQTTCQEKFTKPSLRGRSVECIDNRCTYR